jgi:hypothetical protein
VQTTSQVQETSQTSQFDKLVPDPQVREELGGVTEMSTWRWDKNPDKAPVGWQPPVKIGNRNFRFRSMVEAVKANLLRAAIEKRGV